MALAASMTSHTAGQSSLILSTEANQGERLVPNSTCLETSKPFAKLSGVAWKSLLLLNGGSVAISLNAVRVDTASGLRQIIAMKVVVTALEVRFHATILIRR